MRLRTGWLYLRIVVCLGLFQSHGLLRASDWPQYRGANHDGTSPDLVRSDWAHNPPAEVWRVACPNGLSSFAVSGGHAFTLVLRDGAETCVSLDSATGRELWATAIGSGAYDGSVGDDDGPRSTPSVVGDTVFVTSSFLDLSCLNVSTGARIWAKDLRTAYGARSIGWQSAASPLVDGDLLFMNLNTTANSLFAFRTSDGAVAWRTQTEAMTHSTPVSATLHGIPQVIFASQTALVSVNRTNGALLWKSRYPFTYTTCLAASPVVYSDIVFITANYTMSSYAVKIQSNSGSLSAVPLWTNANYKAHWMTPVVRDGYLYGMFGSSATSPLKCIDLRTGAQKWSVSGFGRGGTVSAGSHLLSLTEKGDLVLFEANAAAYTELARIQAFQGYDPNLNKCWNSPAIADGRVYARSTAQGVSFDTALSHLVLFPSVSSGGLLKLRVSLSNGSEIDSSRASRIQLRYSDSLAIGVGQWAALSQTPTPISGGLEVDGIPTGAGQRFYAVVELP